MKDLYKILIIDLENKTYFIEKIDKKKSDLYMGGYALGLRWMDKNKNIGNPILIFTSSIMKYQNTMNRFSIISKDSNGMIVEGVMGGDFIRAMKSNSYDAIVLLNNTKDMTDIVISSNKVSFNQVNISKPLSNSKTYEYLKTTYGEKFSSIYITKSAMDGDYFARVIEDKYRGVAKGLGYILAIKNIRALTIIENEDMINDFKPLYISDESYRKCEGCITGCITVRKDKNESLFDRKAHYQTYENKMADEINSKLDEYGLDKFALSKSVMFAYENLNDIYKMKSLDIRDLKLIVEEVIKDNRESIYSDLANGESFLRKKYSFKLSFKDKKKSNFKKYAKIMDSAGLCLFSTDAKSLESIASTINTITESNYTEDDLEDLSGKIEKLEQ